MRKILYKTVSGILAAAALSVPVPACSEETIRLTARAVAAECPEAPYGVQIALAAVIFNRMEDPRFGNTAAQVIWSDGFLTCVRTGRITLPPPTAVWEQALSAVICAAEGMDPTGGAVLYASGSSLFHAGTPCYADEGYAFFK